MSENININNEIISQNNVVANSNSHKLRRSKSLSSSNPMMMINYKKRFVSIVLNLGIIVTGFIALIQIFDPTLDEHVHMIQDNKNQQSFVFNSDISNNHPFANIIKQQDKRKHHHEQLLRKKHQLDQMQQKNNNDNHNNQNQIFKNFNEDRVLQLLDEAGFDLTSFNNTQLDQLPKWDDVSINN